MQNGPTESLYEAQAALLLYKLREIANSGPPGFDRPEGTRFTGRKAEQYISLHPIVDGKISSGQPLTRQAALEIAKALLPQAVELIALPDNLVAFAPGTEMYWWLPEGGKHLFFKKDTGIESGVMPVPALLFGVNGDNLRVWALKGNERPTMDTWLYCAPFFNVSGSSVCTGNSNTPDRVRIEDIKKWEKVFFRSAFTYEGTTRVKGITMKKLWRQLSKGEHRKFPVKHLVYCGKFKDVMRRREA